MEYALLSLVPVAALVLSYPRRQWGALAALVASAFWGGSIIMQAGSADQGPTRIIAAWSVIASALAFGICRRGIHEGSKRRLAAESTRARREETFKLLAEHKHKGSSAEREQKETLALYVMIKGLSEAMTWEEIRPTLAMAVNQYLGVRDFALYVAGMQGKTDLEPLVVRNLSGTAGGSWATIARRLVERGLTVNDQFLEEAGAPGPGGPGSPASIGLPIEENEEFLGYFFARVPAGVDAQALLAKARTFAVDISLAFKRVKLFQEVERLSEIDGLTGVYRRGAFEERLRVETIRSQTFKATYGLMLLDIDHFKSINDRYGHPFGDQVLRRVGEILNASVYETDFVARYGGEEFVIILPRAEFAGALRRAEAIRKAVSAERFTSAFETVQVTVSIGVAHFPRDAARPEELVSMADQAMYQAKSRGRDRVVDCSVLRRGA